MILSCDVGSLPPRIDADVIRRGAKASKTVLSLLKSGDKSDPSKAFEDEVVGAFIDKLRAGIDIPNYPQFRDMNEMFFDLLRGPEKTSAGYLSTGGVRAESGASVPEVDALRGNASKIADSAGLDEFRLKVCVTGPYTLASFFQHRDAGLFDDLGRALAEIASKSMFKSKRGGVSLLFIDEPVLGFMNDPLLDYGSPARESLRRAWENICMVASSMNVRTGIHLHDTSDNLFWEVEHLNIVESHVNDPLYTSESTKSQLKKRDKFLKASIAATIFDDLIAGKIMETEKDANVQQRVGEKWSEIRRGLVDPLTFLEDSELMSKRLQRIIKSFGAEYVQYAGPECGLMSHPGYDCAMEYLRRVGDTVRKFNVERSS